MQPQQIVSGTSCAERRLGATVQASIKSVQQSTELAVSSADLSRLGKNNSLAHNPESSPPEIVSSLSHCNSSVLLNHEGLELSCYDCKCPYLVQPSTPQEKLAPLFFLRSSRPNSQHYFTGCATASSTRRELESVISQVPSHGALYPSRRAEPPGDGQPEGVCFVSTQARDGKRFSSTLPALPGKLRSIVHVYLSTTEGLQ